jgi:peptide chain release factor 2
MAADLTEECKELDATLTGIEHVLDIDGMRRHVAELEKEAADPDLWSDQARAQSLTSRLSYRKADIARVEGLRARLDDARTALELEDEDLMAEAAADVPLLRKEIDALEVRTLQSSCRRGPAGSTPPTGRPCCCACICAGPSGAAGRPRCSTPARQRRRG